MKAKEAIQRKKNQKNQGKGSVRGRGAFKPRFQHSQNEARGSSSRPPQRGDSGRGRFVPRGRGRGREIWCFTCGEWGHGSGDCPHNKSTTQRNVNVTKKRRKFLRIQEKKNHQKQENPCF